MSRFVIGLVGCLIVAGSTGAQRTVPRPPAAPPSSPPPAILPPVMHGISNPPGGFGTGAGPIPVDPLQQPLPLPPSEAERDSTDPLLLGLGIGAGALLLVGLAVRLAMKSATPGRIRITAVPPGEAPEEIRGAWVGHVLPLLPGCTEPQHCHRSGTTPGKFEGVEFGWPVDAQAALALLAQANPSAAAWWRERVSLGGTLFFPTSVAEKA